MFLLSTLAPLKRAWSFRAGLRTFVLALGALVGMAVRVSAQDVPLVATDLYTIEPCRAVDTRETPEGPLLPGEIRLMSLDGCGVPSSAYAAVLNISAVSTVGSVELKAFPGDQSPAPAKIVSAGPANPTRSALAVVPLATDGSGTLGVTGVFAGGTGQVHVVLDVTGYFELETLTSMDDPGIGGTSTLGESPLDYDGDTELLDYPEMYSPGLVGTDPSYGYAPSATAAEPIKCSAYTGPSVTPIGVWGNSPRYLSYAGQVKLLMGASADVACHFLYTTNNLMLDKCNSGPSVSTPPKPGQSTPSPDTHYATALTSLKNAGFNKTRLWVALGYEKDRDNVPFNWDAGGYWRLDQKNQGYFDRIRAVVSKAKELDMYVEVTFFAPFQGGGFSGSPWSWNTNKARALDPGQTGPPTRAGFTSPPYAVIQDTRTGVDATRNERMRQYQQKVIEWTIDELWCYDNVFWEIANEPEDQDVHPLNVAAWQRTMIDTVRQKDCPANALPSECTNPLPSLTRRHLIAVQPFTQRGADDLIQDSRISILNGHYTQVRTDLKATLPKPPGTSSRLDLGAIDMARNYANQTKVLGFNEGKITPLGGPGGTRSHVNGVLVERGPEAARAEAWEFLFSRGAILDHWGYLSQDGVSSLTVPAIRQQLSTLKTFMGGVPLARLRTSANPPSWITGGDLGLYPFGTTPWDALRSAQRFWAALQTNENDATARWFLLYMHHSTRRCFVPKGGTEREYLAQGCDDDANPNTAPASPGPYMSLGGYDARVWTTPQAKRYRESLQLNLGPNPGTFDVFWIKPENLQTVKQQAIAWKQSSCSLPSCILCSNPTASNPCSIGLNANEGYDFDILLKIVQR